MSMWHQYVPSFHLLAGVLDRAGTPSLITLLTVVVPAVTAALSAHRDTLTARVDRARRLCEGEIDRSKQERLLRSAELATPETSGLVRWNYFTHCQINILCSSLSAISVMVGNGVTFSYKNIHFSLGSQNIFTTKCD